ncbi:hypothetical protein LUZ62_037421 [Rhynchospora pubera]|uniref:GRAS family transcription factor n=1 Tax=Rhynchospora pubera TaxID=906938 RepID=A0AAV8F187_9POAL|nr:hypothetical protein LUZ62_037421 [Rhynchospora pubera]
MASYFNFCELSDTMNALLPDDPLVEHNNSCSRTSEESQLSVVSSHKVPHAFSDKSTDRNTAKESMIRNDIFRQEIDDLSSNAPVSYIRQLLLEKDADEKISTHEQELALLATEKAFLDILRQEYSSPNEPLLYGSPNQKKSAVSTEYEKSNYGGKHGSVEKGFGHDAPSCNPSLTSEGLTSALSLESFAAQQIQKGIEEAMKFIPNIGEFFVNRESSDIDSLHQKKTETCSIKKDERGHIFKTKKNIYSNGLDQLEVRAQKQILANSDEVIRNEKFDEVVLIGDQKYTPEDTMLRLTMQKRITDKSHRNEARPSLPTCEENQTGDSVDLISLLIQCSQAVSSDDHSLATELISKIKKHTSPYGDSSQRLAYYFVGGLEARLAGTANEIYRRRQFEKSTVNDILKAVRMYLVASPCKRSLIHFANQTILNNITKDTRKVHIINYGIIHGFQWPPFFELFSNWKSTRPIIRITAIEVPEPGFRPKKRIELVGRRLAYYAKSFNVPFEYEGIASKWEDVKVEDLNIANDEVVIVNCVANSELLSDEATATDSPRDIFLNTIRKIKPRIFVHGIINGSYNSTFFPTRFRSALLHFSSLFDMLDSNLPRDNPERLSIESNILMPMPLNAIACEGPCRIERPETYKQWHARKLQAGLVPLPVDPMIKKNMMDFVRENYHKDFVIDDDIGWLLVGWKGRILYGFTAWKSKEV